MAFNESIDLEPSEFEFNPYVVAALQLLIMMVLGTIYCLVLLAVRFEKDLYSLPCYKLMFLLGIIDVTCLVTQVTFNNVLTIAQKMFSLQLHKYMNAFFTGLWYGMYATTAVLSINRCVVAWSKHWSTTLFKGKALIPWVVLIGVIMAIPTIGFCLPGNDGYFNVKRHVWEYAATMSRGITDFQMILWTFAACLIFFCHIMIVLKIRTLRNMVALEKGHGVLAAFVPPFLISVLMASLDFFFFFISSSIHDPWAPLVTDFIGNIASGINGVFYLIFNRSIRIRIQKILTVLSIRIEGRPLNVNQLPFRLPQQRKFASLPSAMLNRNTTGSGINPNQPSMAIGSHRGSIVNSVHRF